MTASLLASVIAAAVEPRASWPSDSLHHLTFPLEASDGKPFKLADTAGRVRIVSMFYASCPMICPMTFETIRQIERGLKESERHHLGIVLVSVDPARDTPEALHELAKARHVDDTAWRLARTSPSNTRALAAALGIQYRSLDNGDFNHSTELVLIDPQGRIVGRSDRIGTPDPEFSRAVREAIRIARE